MDDEKLSLSFSLSFISIFYWIARKVVQPVAAAESYTQPTGFKFTSFLFLRRFSAFSASSNQGAAARYSFSSTIHPTQHTEAGSILDTSSSRTRSLLTVSGWVRKKNKKKSVERERDDLRVRCAAWLAVGERTHRPVEKEVNTFVEQDGETGNGRVGNDGARQEKKRKENPSWRVLKDDNGFVWRWCGNGSAATTTTTTVFLTDPAILTTLGPFLNINRSFGEWETGFSPGSTPGTVGV